MFWKQNARSFVFLLKLVHGLYPYLHTIVHKNFLWLKHLLPMQKSGHGNTLNANLHPGILWPSPIVEVPFRLRKFQIWLFLSTLPFFPEETSLGKCAPIGNPEARIF